MAPGNIPDTLLNLQVLCQELHLAGLDVHLSGSGVDFARLSGVFHGSGSRDPASKTICRPIKNLPGCRRLGRNS